MKIPGHWNLTRVLSDTGSEALLFASLTNSALIEQFRSTAMVWEFGFHRSADGGCWLIQLAAEHLVKGFE